MGLQARDQSLHKPQAFASSWSLKAFRLGSSASERPPGAGAKLQRVHNIEGRGFDRLGREIQQSEIDSHRSLVAGIRRLVSGKNN